MTTPPLISVVMPIYNAQAFLAEAVTSILNQSFSNFELLAVDDGSTDTSASILAQFADQDSRVKVHRHAQNQGLIAALNTGCNRAQGSYIARMDADDISLPQRFERQLQVLESSPAVALVGSWIAFIDDHNVVTGTMQYPTAPSFLKWILPFYCPLAHPSVMMRRSVAAAVGFYREGQLVTEDYDLWTRISRVAQITNVPEVLLHYRVWGESWSARNHGIQQQNADHIAQSIIAELIGTIELPTVRTLRAFVEDQLPHTRSEIQEISQVIQRMQQAFIAREQLTAFERRMVAKDVANKLLVLASQARHYAIGDAIQLVVRAMRISPPDLDQFQRGLQRLRAGNRGQFSRMVKQREKDIQHNTQHNSS